MRKMILVTTSLLLASELFGMAALSASGEDNCKGTKVTQNINITMAYGKARGCFMQIKHSFDSYTANQERTRSWQLYENGLMYMFVETSDKKRMSQSIGARGVHLLPFNPTMSSFKGPGGDGMIELVTPFGLKGTASVNTGNLMSLEGFTVSAGPLKHIDQLIKENGGVTITPKPGYVLVDYGFRMGEIPTSQMWRTVTVSDGYGNTCRLKITNFFKKRPGDAYEVDFLYSTSEEVKAMLGSKCPRIKW